MDPKESVRTFIRILIPTVSLLVIILVLYTTISRLLNWDVFMGFLNYRVPMLLDRLGVSWIKFHLDIYEINEWIVLVTIICTFVLLLTQMHYLRTRTFWLASIPLLALLAITGFSRIWSVTPGVTYTRFNLLLVGALGGVLIGLAIETRKLRTILEVFAVILIIGCILMVFLKPEYAITREPIIGRVALRWIGLFSWKMPAGMMMGFAVVVFFFRLLDFKNDKWPGRIYGLFFLGLSLIMMYKTQSMTEVLSVVAVFTVIILGALYLKWGHHLRPVHWWVLSGLVLILLLVFWIERGFFLGLIGRGANLTGRLPLWISLVPAIKERLFFGYGFGEAFWKNEVYYQPIWNIFPDFRPVFAHNGFIEALMDNGVVGLILWIVFLVQVAFLTLRYFFHERTLSSLFFFSWFVFLVVMNVGNNHLGSYETFTWLMLVISFASMVRNIIDRRSPVASVQIA
jgi:exopolysaccharide production protein ExoQ